MKASFNFLPALTLLFVVLKLTGHLSWSWLLVTSPLWFPLLCLVWLAPLALILYGFVWGICVLIDTWEAYENCG